MRVRDLAKELNVTNQEVIAILKDQGVEVTNYMSAIDSSLVSTVRDTIQGKVEDKSADTSTKRVGAKVIRRRKVKKEKAEEVAEASVDAEENTESEDAAAEEKPKKKAPLKKAVKKKSAAAEPEELEAETIAEGEELASADAEVLTEEAGEDGQAEESQGDPEDKSGGARITGQRIKLEEARPPVRKPRSPAGASGARPGAPSRTPATDLPTPEGQDKKKKGAAGKKERTIKHPKRRVVTKTDKYRNILMDGTKNLRGSATRKKKKGEKAESSTVPMSDRKRKIRIEESILVGDLAKQMGVKSSDIVKKFMDMGMQVTANNAIDPETAQIMAADYEFEIEITRKTEEEMLTTVEDREEDLLPRPPVVTIMGHVDHGKTSILDAIRKARVADGEAGGITQHIGAYQIERKGQQITFIDTPGHAAFSAMRLRGASVTDIVILVVAADDGVMPQTIEAINHAKSAGVPIIVAVNKMDLDGANPDKVTQQLSEHGVIPEAWGGDNLFVELSAQTGDGLEKLLDTILLQSEMLSLMSNPKRDFVGTVLEATIDKGKGPLATVLVSHGTLKKGDIVLVDTYYGRVRSLTDDQGNVHKEATPGTPIAVQGLNGVPSAGDMIVTVKNEKTAREIGDRRRQKDRETQQAKRTKLTLEDLFTQSGADKVQEVPLVIKGDVQGSVEAIISSLEALSTDECKVTVVQHGVGGISENDINLAGTAGAFVLGFNVRADSKSSRLATQLGVEIRSYSVIYTLIDDMRQALLGTLAPDEKEESLGWARVKDIFPISDIGTIAGCMVESGKVLRGCGVRLIRDGKTIYEGTVDNLKRFKDDVKEVAVGKECGILLNNHNDVVEGDELELFHTIKVERTEL